MERCYFAKEPPDIEVRGGLVFIRPEGGHCEVAVTPHTLAAFIAAANRALDQLYEHRRIGVSPIKVVQL